MAKTRTVLYKHQLDTVSNAGDKLCYGLLHEMGCVTGDTKIYDPVLKKEIAIKKLYQEKSSIKFCLSYMNSAIHIFPISKFIKKKKDKMYIVKLENGSSIKCSIDHVFLTIQGWMALSGVHAGEQIAIQQPSFYNDHASSILDNALSALSASVQNSLKKPQDCLDDCLSCFHQYDEPLRLLINTYLASFLLQACVLAPCHEKSEKGAMAYKLVYTHSYQFEHRHASTDSYFHIDSSHTLFQALYTALIQFLLSNHTVSLFLLLTNHYLRDSLLCLYLPKISCSSKPSSLYPFNYSIQYSKVKSIKYIGKHDVYDMHVPVSNNYICNGIINHNTGKTLTMLAILCNQQFDPVIHKALIVCPKGVINSWKNQILQHTDIEEKHVHVLTGPIKERIKRIESKGLYIINYEGLRLMVDYLYRYDWDYIILDEAQRIKCHSAQQTKAALALSKRAKRRFVMTGTPILNSLLDIFTLYKFLDFGQSFGTNFYAFRNKYFRDLNAGFRSKPQYFPNWKPIEGNDQEVQSIMYKIADRKLKEECLDLPPKVYEMIEIDMTPEQRKHYETIKKELITFLEDSKSKQHTVIAQTALTKILRLNQITSGFLNTTEQEIVEIKSSKANALKELVNDLLPNKIIIWAYFRHDIEMIAEMFKHLNPAILYGGTKSDQPQDEKFQTDETCKLFIGQPRSGGLGITLTKANYAIYYSQNYSLEDRMQSEDRCHRAGSEIHDKITIIDLICKDSVDEIIVKAVRTKKNLAANILDVIHDITATSQSCSPRSLNAGGGCL